MTDLAIVLAGGGARAAYQAGVLRAVSRRFPDLSVAIFTGVSAGAINSAFLANHSGNFEQAVMDLCELWGDLRTEKVIDARLARLFGRAFSWSMRLGLGGATREPKARGMVDTAPLRRLLATALCREDDASLLVGVEQNIRMERLRALALTSTNYDTGQPITWVTASDSVSQRAVRQSRACRMTVDHVMASAAIPLFFPAVQLEGGWHGDGGVRQTTPLSPALHLGARRILAISPRRNRAELEPRRAEAPPYPPPAQILGILMNAVFLDNLDHDAGEMARLNELLVGIAPEQRKGLLPVELLVVRPSADLGRIAGEYEHTLPRGFRYLLRGWGTKETPAADSIAMLLFEAEYTQRLMEIGERDGEQRMADIEKLVLDA